MAPQAPIGKLLELSLISAQDLAMVSKSMRTYAVAWVHTDRKLTTRVDEEGNANPTWNEKFVFKVDEETLESDEAEVTVEIYALTWLRVVLAGTVTIRIADLVPPECRKPGSENFATRFLTLKILRPSGRPKGTVNIGVAFISGSLRSMPLQYSELSVSTYNNGEKENPNPNPNLWRSRSERTDDKYYPYYPGSVCNDSIVNEPRKQSGAGSAVGGGSLISDIGPSASVVAAAIAKGLYKRKVKESVVDDGANSVLTEQDSVEGLKTKIERWRSELPPVYDRKSGVPNPKGGHGQKGKNRRDRGGLFSCFGSALGCEFSISCGGSGGGEGSSRDKKKNR